MIDARKHFLFGGNHFRLRHLTPRAKVARLWIDGGSAAIADADSHRRYAQAMCCKESRRTVITDDDVGTDLLEYPAPLHYATRKRQCIGEANIEQHVRHTGWKLD